MTTRWLRSRDRTDRADRDHELALLFRRLEALARGLRK
jgi:hypothetical protein